MLLVLRVLSVACFVLCLLLARAVLGQHQTAGPGSSAVESPARNGVVAGSNPALGSVLLRAVVAESDWHGDDQAAVLHVLAKRAERTGVSLGDMAERYVSAFRAEPVGRLAWVMSLELGCAEPAGWPSRLSWAKHAHHCRATVARIGRFLAGELPDPCRNADHWGSRHLASDLARAHRAGWVLARCNRATRNFFWTVP